MDFVPDLVALAKLNVSTPGGEAETLVLRWLHFVAGTIWIGLLYFMNLVYMPAGPTLEPSVRQRVIVNIMPRLWWWFRWSAALAWLVGFRYFMILAKTDATNAGDPAAMWKWIGIWLAVWIVAFAVLYALWVATPIAFGNRGEILAVAVALIIPAVSWLVLTLLAQPGVSNRVLSIAVGGGLGTIMLLSTWGVVWRCQKRLIAWNKEALEKGTALPAEAARLQRLVFLTARTNFYLSFPMLFFMATSAHYPFLSGE